uniref:Uncharacterized protein n=1 Tax=Solanum lycopersicum TaxID=4081 RepID=A0A3Q7G0H8_SOLLC
MSTWTQDRPKTRIVGRFHGIFLLRIANFRRSFTLLRLKAVTVAGLLLQKWLESLTEAELQVLLEQVEEEKTRLTSGEEVK